MRVALVSCVKTKRSARARARSLYLSPLFVGLRAYAEANADRWFILSALHGVLDPREIVEPYNVTLGSMSRAERAEWARLVRAQLVHAVPPGADVMVLAGARYREAVVPFLQARGHAVTVPFEGLQLGQQLQALKEFRAGRCP